MHGGNFNKSIYSASYLHPDSCTQTREYAAKRIHDEDGKRWRKKVQNERRSRGGRKKGAHQKCLVPSLASEPFRLAEFEIFSRVANKRAVNGKTVIIIAPPPETQRCTNDGSPKGRGSAGSV